MTSNLLYYAECKIKIVEQSLYYPSEFVSHCGNESEAVYYCYLVELPHDSYNDSQLHGIILAVRTKLKFDDEILAFDLDVDRRGRLKVQLNYRKVVIFTSEEVRWFLSSFYSLPVKMVGELHLFDLSLQIRRCQRFQVSVFRILRDPDLSKLQEVLAAVQSPIGSAVSDYLLLPSVGTPPEINWQYVNSLLFPSQVLGDKHMDWCSTQGRRCSVNTISEVVCSCMLENSLVCTPHNGRIYCINGFLENLDCNSLMGVRSEESITYREHYRKRFVQLASDFLFPYIIFWFQNSK